MCGKWKVWQTFSFHLWTAVVTSSINVRLLVLSQATDVWETEVFPTCKCLDPAGMEPWEAPALTLHLSSITTLACLLFFRLTVLTQTDGTRRGEIIRKGSVLPPLHLLQKLRRRMRRKGEDARYGAPGSAYRPSVTAASAGLVSGLLVNVQALAKSTCVHFLSSSLSCLISSEWGGLAEAKITFCSQLLQSHSLWHSLLGDTCLESLEILPL